MIEYLKKLPDEHKYARLATGNCHYKMEGPECGKLILLVHGATVAGWIFEQLTPYLIKANFRLITIDLFGHGYSERLNNHQYDIKLFKRQIVELLDSLETEEIPQPVNIIGHSLGAAIAVSLANENPQRFRRLVLTAPLINFMANKPIVKLFSIPFLGDILNKLYVIPMLKRRRRIRYAPIADGQYIDKFLSQFELPGFEKTVLSLFRSGILTDKSELYQQFSQTQLPSLVIYGEQDELVTLEQIRQLKNLLPNSQFIGLSEAGHAFILSEPERIASQLINFIESET